MRGGYPLRILLFRMVTRPTEDPPEGDLATTTLAEIYVQQGLYERAVAIYQRLATRAPQDLGVAERIEALMAKIERGRDADERSGTSLASESVGEPARSPSAELAETIEEDQEFEQWLGRR